MLLQASSCLPHSGTRTRILRHKPGFPSTGVTELNFRPKFSISPSSVYSVFCIFAVLISVDSQTRRKTEEIRSELWAASSFSLGVTLRGEEIVFGFFLLFPQQTFGCFDRHVQGCGFCWVCWYCLQLQIPTLCLLVHSRHHHRHRNPLFKVNPPLDEWPLAPPLPPLHHTHRWWSLCVP